MSRVPLTTTQSRQDRLVELLPQYDWSIIKAGIAAGYSESYAKGRLPAIVRKNALLCSRIAKMRTATEVTTLDLRDQAIATLQDIIANLDTAQRDRISAVSELGRINGWHSETRVLETGPRAEQLRQAEIAVARRAALACYDTHLLEDGSYAPAAPAMQHGTVIVASNDIVGETAAAADADVTSDMDADAIPDEQDT